MNKYVGYLVKQKDGLYGERGLLYDYILASNGLFIETEGKLIAARIPVAPCEVRGLAPVEPKVVLRYGKVPKHLFDLALNTMMTTPDKERYVAITYTDSYHISVPNQAADKDQIGKGVNDGHGSGAGVAYLNPDSVLLDMHTHPKMPAYFSQIDNRDETGLRLYAVVGHFGIYHEVTDDMSHDEAMGWIQNNTRAIRLRVGVYGYFHPIAWKDVFEGELGSEMFDISEEEPERADEEARISHDLMLEALRDPGVPQVLKEDIKHELYG